MCSFTTKRPKSLLYTDRGREKRRRGEERDTNITGCSGKWKRGCEKLERGGSERRGERRGRQMEKD